MDCILTQGRKNGAPWSPPSPRGEWKELGDNSASQFEWNISLKETDDDCPSQADAGDYTPQFERRPSFDVELLRAGGVMRDRTIHFHRMRLSLREAERAKAESLVFARRRKSSRDAAELPGDSKTDLSEKLTRSFEEASQLHSSLASKLAQHNGLRQFGVDFVNRAPPLELRMLLPDLEASIEKSLTTLEELRGKVLELQDVAAGRNHELCGALAQYVANIYEKSSEAFKEQCQHLQKLAVASPLFSPVLSPALTKRLSAAMKSPASSRASSPGSTTASPGVSPLLASTSPNCSPRGSSRLPKGSLPAAGRSPNLACRSPMSELRLPQLSELPATGNSSNEFALREESFQSQPLSQESPFSSLFALFREAAPQAKVGGGHPIELEKQDELNPEVFDMMMIVEDGTPHALQASVPSDQ